MKKNTVLALDRASFNQGRNAQFNFTIEEELASALVAKGPSAVMTGGGTDMKYLLRRLMPIECERLQGYPDNWTAIGDWTDSKGKLHKASDTPRYKALGNSIAIPAWVDILSKIADKSEGKTMASLFDGIGGFPLIWEKIIGGKAVWASEIEEFPIAVTKLRFPEEKDEVE